MCIPNSSQITIFIIWLQFGSPIVPVMFLMTISKYTLRASSSNHLTFFFKYGYCSLKVKEVTLKLFVCALGQCDQYILLKKV